MSVSDSPLDEKQKGGVSLRDIRESFDPSVVRVVGPDGKHYKFTEIFCAAFDHADTMEKLLDQAAEWAFRSEVIETEMLSIELEGLPGVSAEQFKDDWKWTWIDELRREIEDARTEG